MGTGSAANTLGEINSPPSPSPTFLESLQRSKTEPHGNPSSRTHPTLVNPLHDSPLFLSAPPHFPSHTSHPFQHVHRSGWRRLLLPAFCSADVTLNEGELLPRQCCSHRGEVLHHGWIKAASVVPGCTTASFFLPLAGF